MFLFLTLIMQLPAGLFPISQPKIKYFYLDVDRPAVVASLVDLYLQPPFFSFLFSFIIKLKLKDLYPGSMHAYSRRQFCKQTY